MIYFKEGLIYLFFIIHSFFFLEKEKIVVYNKHTIKRDNFVFFISLINMAGVAKW